MCPAPPAVSEPYDHLITPLQRQVPGTFSPDKRGVPLPVTTLGGRFFVLVNSYFTPFCALCGDFLVHHRIIYREKNDCASSQDVLN